MRSIASLQGVVLEGSPAARNPNYNPYKNPELLFVLFDKFVFDKKSFICFQCFIL